MNNSAPAVAKINLLPREVLLERKKNLTTNLINRLCLAALLGLAFLTAAVLSARLWQRLELSKSNDFLTQAEAKVSSLADRQSQLTLIREYLKNIQSYASADTKKKAVFNLVAFIAPADVSFNDISIGKDGSTVISAASPSLLSIERLIDDLSSPEKSSELIGKIDLEGLSLGKDSIYRFGLRITTK